MRRARIGRGADELFAVVGTVTLVAWGHACVFVCTVQELLQAGWLVMLVQLAGLGDVALFVSRLFVSCLVGLAVRRT